MAKKNIARKTKNASAKKATHGRAPGKTQISISLPEGLVAKIDVLATAENRNRSNYIATALDNLTAKG